MVNAVKYTSPMDVSWDSPDSMVSSLLWEMQVWRQLMERYLNTETAFDPLNACNLAFKVGSSSFKSVE